jgi:hypothetical protein
MGNAGLEDWSILVSLFPSGWQEQARTSGAVERLRGLPSTEVLLRVLLLHIARGYSLRETSVRARLANLVSTSDVTLLNRLRQCEPWLRWLCVQLLAESGVSMAGLPESRKVRIVDGTIVREPGKTGSEWRILYSVRLPDLWCDFFELTPAEGEGNGESLTRVPVAAGDLVLADAGYCSSPGIGSLVARGGDVLVRVNPRNFLALEQSGKPLPLLSWLQKLEVAGQVGELPVSLSSPTGTLTGRLCALRKSDLAIAQAHRRLARKASKRQTQTLPETWEFAKYVVVFTTWWEPSAGQVLECYRVRWQVELAFKRLKSLAQMGHLPKHDERSCRAWLYGKLFVALLTQKLIRLGRDISPWGYRLAPATLAQ